MLLGEAAHVWPYADADAGPIPAAACPPHQPVYPVAGSSSSHLLLQHPNVILDASHEPRLAIIGSTVSPPHSSMNARSDRLAIDGSSPSVTRHKLGMSMRKVFTAPSQFRPIGVGVDLHGLCCRACFPDIYFTPPPHPAAGGTATQREI